MVRRPGLTAVHVQVGWEERPRMGTLHLRICQDRGLCVPNLISFRWFLIHLWASEAKILG